eukprot:922840-Pleurochrysis_carterae.AAC.1
MCETPTLDFASLNARRARIAQAGRPFALLACKRPRPRFRRRTVEPTGQISCDTLDATTRAAWTCARVHERTSERTRARTRARTHEHAHAQAPAGLGTMA